MSAKILDFPGSGSEQAHPSASGFTGSVSGDAVQFGIPAMSESSLPDSPDRDLLICSDEICCAPIPPGEAHFCAADNSPYCDACIEPHRDGGPAYKEGFGRVMVGRCEHCTAAKVRRRDEFAEHLRLTLLVPYGKGLMG